MAKAEVYFKNVASNLRKRKIEAKKEILKDMAEDSDFFVPEDTGRTRNEMQITNNSVKWENEYIEYIYWGINPKTGKELNIKRVKNPNAQSKWIDKAISVHGDKWEKKYADIIERAFYYDR